MTDFRKIAHAMLGMGTMAAAQTIEDVPEWSRPSINLLPTAGMRGKKRKNTDEENKSFSKKVEKRRKKNKNKKTHRR